MIASPAASYFAGDLRPVSVWLAHEYTRAAPGGTGAAKTGGNYAAAFAGQMQALDHGCDQVVWLDAVEHRWVEEMGGMNLFFVYGSGPDARIMTPALTGTLLPGITRDALLTLAPELGIPASEGKISVEEWRAGCESGEITEVFACGTAAVITPVGTIKGATAAGRSATARPARSPCGCARSCSASSTVTSPTRTAGSTRSSSCPGCARRIWPSAASAAGARARSAGTSARHRC